MTGWQRVGLDERPAINQRFNAEALRHITGHAVDLGAWVDDEVRWDWPLYHQIAKAMKTAAAELGVAIVWGGDWSRFKDGPHYELDRRKYQ